MEFSGRITPFSMKIIFFVLALIPGIIYSNVTILNKPRSDLQQEALRLVYSQKQWLPAMRNGRKVKGWKRRVIYFKL